MDYQYKWVIAFFPLVLLGFGCNEPTESQAIPPPIVGPEEEASEIIIDLTSLDSSFTKDTLTIEIKNDPVFGKTKKYLAFSLQPILEKAVADNSIDTFSTELIYTCTDGYQPSNRLQDVMDQGTGYLAFKDLEAPEGQAWLPENSKKYPPFYLVWKDLPSNADLLAWPYGVYSLTLTSSDAVYNTIYPQEKEHLQTAFELYKKNCIKCHSINKIGGIMGPEFNYPTNITSYWKRENIIAFAKNPQSFRYNSKMPPINNLSTEQFNLIVDYLEYIADYQLTESE